MDLSLLSHPNVNDQHDAPVCVVTRTSLRIVPRHLTDETIDVAREYGDYNDDPALKREEERGGRIGTVVERERMRRWEAFVDATAPTFTTRADALAFMAQLRDAINAAWPVA